MDAMHPSAGSSAPNGLPNTGPTKMKQTQKTIAKRVRSTIIVVAGGVPIEADPSDCAGDVRLAVIGDFGDAAQPEADVAEMVNGWQVDFIACMNFTFYNRSDEMIDSYTLAQYGDEDR